MIIGKLTLPYNDFKIGDVIDSEEFDTNNETIVTVVNEIIDLLNHVEERTEDIFFPNYIKETYIDGVELRSPKITGNTLVGSSGMVGITSVGDTNDSVRIWAGSNSVETAPFRVKQDGSVVMSKLNINLGVDGSAGITSDTSYSNSVVMWAGGIDKDIAPFRVTKDGSVTMNNATVGANGVVGMTSNASTDNSVVIWAGNSNKNIAPFKVTKDGSVTLRRVDITFDEGGNYGMNPNEPGENPIVLWAGNENKLIAPFRVTKRGHVTMTNASLETQSDNGLYIKMNGTKVEGGNHALGRSYTLGTADLTGSLRSGVLRLEGYSSKESSEVTRVMDITSNTVMVNGSNLVLGGFNGSHPIVMTRTIMSDSHTKSVLPGVTLHVDGGLNLTGDLYVNGVKMKLTPA